MQFFYARRRIFRVTLDALARYNGVSLAARSQHTALVDTELLAECVLAMAIDPSLSTTKQ